MWPADHQRPADFVRVALGTSEKEKSETKKEKNEIHKQVAQNCQESSEQSK